MLPSVTGYLLGTRQPIDYAGKAIDAFTQVSAELRATRAQNLAESQEARQAGQQAFERPMQAAGFQDDMMTSALNRELAVKDQQMQEADFAFRMKQAQWEQQNLMPLKIQAERARIQNYQSQAAERSYTLQSEMDLRRQFGQEADDLNRSLQLVAQGPQEGQEADAYYESIRKTTGLLNNLKTTWGNVGDPAVKGFLSAAEGRLSKIPGYRYLSARGDLKTFEEREAIGMQRQTAFDAKMPFRSDADRNLWMGENAQRWENAKSLPDESFTQWLKDESTRVGGDRRFNPEPGDPERQFRPTAQQSEAIYKLHAAFNQGKDKVNIFGDGDLADEKNEIPIDQAMGLLRNMGIPDNLLPQGRIIGGQFKNPVPNYFPQSPGSRGRVSRDSATPAEGEEGAAQGLIDIINGKL